MKRIILFGCSGMLGNYVYYMLCADYIVYCFARQDFDIESQKWAELETRIVGLLDTGDVIINCAGVIPQKCSDPEANIIVNTLFPQILAKICARHDLQLIHITTDCVYSGEKGDYVETDWPDANSLYGMTKAAGEPDDACVIRTSIIGEEISGRAGLLEWVLSCRDCPESGTIRGYTNHWWNGVTCLTLARYIKEKILDGGDFWRGTRHLYTTEPVNKYALCSMISSLYKLGITIETHQTSKSINRTLRGEIPVRIPIRAQLEEQQRFNIRARADSRSLFSVASTLDPIRYFVIHNLEPERRARLLRDFKQYGVDHNYVKWMLHPNAADLTDAFIAQNTQDGRSLYPYESKYPLRTGQIACTYKHYLALKDIVARSYPYAVVIEDNMGLTANVPALVRRYLRELPAEWSILFDNTLLEYIEGKTSDDRLVYPKTNKVTAQCRGGSKGAAFYLVSQNTARALKDAFLPIGEVSDHWYNYLFRALNIQTHWIHPPQVYVAPHISTA